MASDRGGKYVIGEANIMLTLFIASIFLWLKEIWATRYLTLTPKQGIMSDKDTHYNLPRPEQMPYARSVTIFRKDQTVHSDKFPYIRLNPS